MADNGELIHLHRCSPQIEFVVPSVLGHRKASGRGSQDKKLLFWGDRNDCDLNHRLAALANGCFRFGVEKFEFGQREDDEAYFFKNLRARLDLHFWPNDASKAALSAKRWF